MHKKLNFFKKNFPKFAISSVVAPISMDEYFVLLFVHELPLNHALRVMLYESCTSLPFWRNATTFCRPNVETGGKPSTWFPPEDS